LSQGFVSNRSSGTVQWPGSTVPATTRSTPRAWLEAGKSIIVRDAPTSFGPVSYSIKRQQNVVHIDVTPPASLAPVTLRLRLRLPTGQRIATVNLSGDPVPFLAKTGTIDLTGRAGELELVALVATS
jgi:hypothetical protein